MANLSAYIDFNIIMSKDPSVSSMILRDPDNYPAGVDATLKGYFVITQPDTITITGNYASPDISWTGSQLSIATKELRLRSNGGFEQGTYTITYHITAPGYDETILTKSFELSYTSPTLLVSNDFNVFIPQLSVTDDTVYTQAGMTISSTVRNWEATIISVNGTNQDILGSLQTFYLSYLGSYYDSRYDVTLTSTATYVLNLSDDWVTIVDQQEYTHTYYAFIPPSLIQLLSMLTAYKATVDAGHCICGVGCVDNCTQLKNTYSLAVGIYSHIVSRGQLNETDGLDAYVLQLEKLLSNCITPVYTNTNQVIPAYNWGIITYTGIYVFYKQMIVGSGVDNAPADGATSYTDANLVNKHVAVFVDGLELGTGLGDRFSYAYVFTTGTINWNSSLAAGQLIRLYTY